VITDALTSGALVRDTKRDRIGIYMGRAGRYAMLRPIGGGQEWETLPEDLRPEVSPCPRPADIEQLLAAYRDHLAERETCGPEAACDIGRVLSLAYEEAARLAESVSPAEEV
jgi:hypothetical protein